MADRVDAGMAAQAAKKEAKKDLKRLKKEQKKAKKVQEAQPSDRRSALSCRGHHAFRFCRWLLIPCSSCSSRCRRRYFPCAQPSWLRAFAQLTPRSIAVLLAVWLLSMLGGAGVLLACVLVHVLDCCACVCVRVCARVRAGGGGGGGRFCFAFEAFVYVGFRDLRCWIRRMTTLHPRAIAKVRARVRVTTRNRQRKRSRKPRRRRRRKAKRRRAR